MKIIRSSRQHSNTTVALSPGNNNWAEGQLSGFDIESTGPDPETDRIVSASLIIDTPGEQQLVREWLIRPEAKEIDLEATAVHGISTQWAIDHGTDAKNTIDKMIDALANSSDIPMVVVNGSFDFTMLVRESERYGYDATPIIDRLLIIDTLICDRMLDPWRSGRRTLTATAAAYGIAIRGAHQSTGDVLCAIKLARAMARRYPDFAWCDLEELQRTQAIAHQKWLDDYTDFQRMEDPSFTADGEWPYRIGIVQES